MSGREAPVTYPWFSTALLSSRVEKGYSEEQLPVIKFFLKMEKEKDGSSATARLLSQGRRRRPTKFFYGYGP